MTTVDDVLTVARGLSPLQQLELIQALSGLLQQQLVSTEAVSTQAPVRHASLDQPRVLGLRAGQLSISDDFDAELPDEFWFGTDDEPPAYHQEHGLLVKTEQIYLR